MKGLFISFNSDANNAANDDNFARAARVELDRISRQFGVEIVADPRIVEAQSARRSTSSTPMSNTRVATGEIPPSTSEEF